MYLVALEPDAVFALGPSRPELFYGVCALVHACPPLSNPCPFSALLVHHTQHERGVYHVASSTSSRSRLSVTVGEQQLVRQRQCSVSCSLLLWSWPQETAIAMAPQRRGQRARGSTSSRVLLDALAGNCVTWFDVDDVLSLCSVCARACVCVCGPRGSVHVWSRRVALALRGGQCCRR